LEFLGRIPQGIWSEMKRFLCLEENVSAAGDLWLLKCTYLWIS
jgi:hypothetical protein